MRARTLAGVLGRLLCRLGFHRWVVVSHGEPYLECRRWRVRRRPAERVEVSRLTRAQRSGAVDIVRSACYDLWMGWLRGAFAAVVVMACVVAAAAVATAAPGCPATPTDGFGPFGRGSPPVRASIGKGHVLSGVVLSALNCKPIARARVELWQSNAKGRYVRATSATVLTDGSGRFRFEGPYPVSYEGLAPHIHLRVVAPAHEVLLFRYEPGRGARRGSVRLVVLPQAV